MTDKERLQDIKKKYNYERLGEFIDVKPVNTYELKWLIQQAERVQELEKENKQCNKSIEFETYRKCVRGENDEI